MPYNYTEEDHGKWSLWANFGNEVLCAKPHGLHCWRSMSGDESIPQWWWDDYNAFCNAVEAGDPRALEILPEFTSYLMNKEHNHEHL
jgi:hypothetical protein